MVITVSGESEKLMPLVSFLRANGLHVNVVSLGSGARADLLMWHPDDLDWTGLGLRSALITRAKRSVKDAYYYIYGKDKSKKVTVFDICKMTEGQFLATRQTGKIALGTVQTVLARYGLRLGMTDDELKHY